MGLEDENGVNVGTSPGNSSAMNALAGLVPDGMIPTGETPTGETPDGVAEENKGFFIENPLVGKKEINGTSDNAGGDGSQQSFENVEDIEKYFKESHGVESITDVSTLLNESKENSVKLDELSTKMGNVQNLFKSMPAELHEAITAFTEGKDWRGVVSSSTIDFTKDVSEHDKKELVNNFAKGKVTDDDWAEYNDEDGDTNVKRYVDTVIESAMSAYSGKKENIKAASESKIRQAQENNELFLGSVNDSKNHIKTRFENVEMSLVENIEELVKSPNGVLSLFFDDKGMLKPDGFERIALAQHGADLIDQYKAAAERQNKEAVLQEVLSRGANTPNTSKGSGSNQDTGHKVGKEAQDVLAGIAGLTGQKFE